MLRKINYRMIGVAAVFIGQIVSLHAVPPGPGINAPGKRTCFVNVPEALRRASAFKAAKARGALMAPPSNPSPQVLVIRVDFPTQQMSTSLAGAQAFFQSMRDYFVEVSYNTFFPTFTVSTRTSGGSAGLQGSYRLGSYNNYNNNINFLSHNQALFDDAAAAAAVDYTMSHYDHVMIYHAGNGQETSGSTSDIWSVYLSDVQTVSGHTFPGFTIVPESEAHGYSPLGVICHEYGHQLGLPDLYDISDDGGRSTVGAWSLMDFPYTGDLTGGGTQDGSNPPHLDPWCRKFLGFGSIQNVSGSLTLAPSETNSNGFNQAAVFGQEYFLMEYRLRASGAGYDRGLPMSGGLVVWHIDDSVALNSTVLANNTVNTPSDNGFNRLGIDLVEADGESVNPWGGDIGLGDAFVDSQNVESSLTTLHSGRPSWLTIAGISGVGTGTLSAEVNFFRASNDIALIDTVNYPNPAGNLSKYPVRTGAPSGTLTTIVVQLSKPATAGDLKLDIFNAEGKRVREVSGSHLTLKIGSNEPTSDYKWIYEYDWDGKNSGGEKIASGLYFYRIEAGSQTKMGKIVVIK